MAKPSSGCGSTCATAGSATACSPAATRRWWTPPARPGTRSWPSRGGSTRSPTFFGGLQRQALRELGMRGAPGRGTLEKDKPPVLGLLQRGGEVVLRMLANVQRRTTRPVIEATVVEGALVHTDEYGVYARLEAWGYRHKTVCHARGEYARDDDGDGF